MDVELVEQAGSSAPPLITRPPPQIPTSLPPAAARACSSAASIPPVTNVYVVPPCMGIGSRRSWVTTKTGIPNGGGSPHGSNSDVEHPLADDDRPGARVDLVADLGVGVRAPVEHPVVQTPGIVAESIADGHVRLGDEPVERHRHLGVDLRHCPPPVVSRAIGPAQDRRWRRSDQRRIEARHRVLSLLDGRPGRAARDPRLPRARGRAALRPDRGAARPDAVAREPEPARSRAQAGCPAVPSHEPPRGTDRSRRDASTKTSAPAYGELTDALRRAHSTSHDVSGTVRLGAHNAATIEARLLAVIDAFEAAQSRVHRQGASSCRSATGWTR